MNKAYYVFSTPRNVAQIVEEEISNAGVPPCSDQVPHLEEDVNNDQAPVNPPPMTDEDIRSSLFLLTKYITTQAQSALLNTKPGKPKLIRRLYPKNTNKLFPWPPI